MPSVTQGLGKLVKSLNTLVLRAYEELMDEIFDDCE